jgi:uncharacterized protein YkwD
MSKANKLLIKRLVNSFKLINCFLTIAFLFFSLHVFSQKSNYVKIIEPILNAPTIFPDSLYTTFNWKQFETFQPAQEPVNIDNPDYHLLNAAVFYHTNAYRQKMKKPLLQFSPELRNAALHHSLQMSEKGFYNHNNPFDKKMREPVQRIRNFGLESNYYAENINKEFALDYNEGKYFDKDSLGWYYLEMGVKGAYIPMLSYFELAKRIVQSWIKSKPHQQNLLDRNFSHLGCAVVFDKKTIRNRDMPKVIATQDFAGGIFSDLYNLR